MNQFKAFLKYIASFLKSEWAADDYPLRYREQAQINANTPRWVVQIVNWWVMSGLGETREEAKLNLVEHLKRYQEAGKALPRPGARVPFEYAETARVDMYPEIARRFFREVLDFKSGGPAFYSDKSSLFDFPMGGDLEEKRDKIRQVFGVDVSDIEDGNLADIFERIEQGQA